MLAEFQGGASLIAEPRHQLPLPPFNAQRAVRDPASIPVVPAAPLSSEGHRRSDTQRRHALAPFHGPGHVPYAALPKRAGATFYDRGQPYSATQSPLAPVTLNGPGHHCRVTQPSRAGTTPQENRHV